jgi:hypothetical protein
MLKTYYTGGWGVMDNRKNVRFRFYTSVNNVGIFWTGE